jgi:hypothetical protein
MSNTILLIEVPIEVYKGIQLGDSTCNLCVYVSPAIVLFDDRQFFCI